MCAILKRIYCKVCHVTTGDTVDFPKAVWETRKYVLILHAHTQRVKYLVVA